MRQRNCCPPAQCAVAFGLGLAVSCFCPTGLLLFMVAIILVVLGITLLKCRT